MELRLPPIRDLNLHDDMRQPAHPAPTQGPVVRDERLQKVLGHCQALCAFADHYASSPPPPNPPEVAQMVDRAVEVITILQEYKQATCPPSAPARPPKRPWEDTTDDIATPRPAPSPPADRCPSPVSAPSSPAASVSPAQEAQMTVFDGQPERHSVMDDDAKAVAIRDMEDIRARRNHGQVNITGKVKYKKRSRATPPGSCHSCEITDTPEWRRGPDGQRTLCNACGLHYAKLVRKRDRIISSLPAGGEAPPPIDIAFLRKSARMAAENSALARSSAGRRRVSDKDKSKVGSPVASHSKPSSTSTDNGRRTWARRDKAEPVPQYTHTATTSPAYSTPQASSPTRPLVSMPVTLPPPPQTRYAAPGSAPMSYGPSFQPYVQAGPAPQPSYQMGPPPPGNTWGYDHAHAHHPAGPAPPHWGGDRYMPPHPR
ncbi:unnamed protein product [Rhizoctonia solani]|uniref:GATA-type domain-containing protein n=1 Tax=Rhizoctonia solani TaxID=456999 RepID=A0A8H3CPL4_9AGAM|nr:unnamed protein product [Rhizoctonia solani]